MKLQGKTASSDLFFLIDKDQYLLLKKQDLNCSYRDAQTKKKEPTTKIKIYWNAFQANGSKLQKDSVASGYFATSFEVAQLPIGEESKKVPCICGEEVKGGYLEEVLNRLEGKENLKDRLRVIYLGPGGNRLIIVSKFYEGYKNIKACQENLCKALGWTCTKGCCNLNRDYPFPMEELTLYEDGRIWTEMDDENGVFIKSDQYKLEYDTESNTEYIGANTNWISFPTIVDMLETRQEADLLNQSYDYGDGRINAETEEMQKLHEEEMEYRNDLLSDDHVPEVWPFPLNLIADIAPYNFIRPMLITSCMEVTTMLNAFKGNKRVPFKRKDRKHKDKVIETMVDQPVTNGLFMIVEGPQSSGKSNFSKLHNMLWSQHRLEDDEVYAAENEYNDKANRRGQNKQLEKMEHQKVNQISPKTSFSELLARISYNKGRMMVCHSPELNDLFSSLANDSNAKEVGGKFSSFLRMIYDQDEFSVDYKTYNSTRGFHKGCINYMICGTPGARKETFKNPEDGLVSRIWFVSLNKEKGNDEPVWDVMTAEEEERFAEFQRWTIQSRNEMEERSEYFKVEGSEFVYDCLKKWENEVVDKATETLDESMISFVRRSRDNVNAVGCILYLLFQRYHKDMSERKIKAAVKKIVLWLAEQRLMESCFRYEVNRNEQMLDERPKMNVFNELPEEFYLSELAAKMSAAKMRTSASSIIAVWLNRNKIKLISTPEEKAKGVKRYKKICE